MAIMIPDACPARATAGEKRVYDLLRDALQDSFTAWFEPVVGGRYPDFTLLADTFGLLAIEVKGWYLKQVARVTDQDVELIKVDGGGERIERHKNPIRQVRDYHFALMDALKRPDLDILCHSEGEHRGGLAFPCGYGVVFTNIVRPHLDAAGLSAVFPPEKVICRDELEALAGAGDRAAIRRLAQLFSAHFSFDPLTEDQLRTIKGVLHREVVVRARPATPESSPARRPPPPGAVTLDVLDALQEQAARSAGEGHRVIFGIAGSGKTVLLLARARLLAGRDPRKKILILCYNKALAADLAAQIASDPASRNVEVRNFHAWASRVTRLRKRDDESFVAYEARLVSALIEGARGVGEPEKYDAILIDEAHDFEPDWFRCVTAMLRGGPEGDLMIVLDGAQNLYGRAKALTWKSVGVQAQGRSRRLSRNYRNTKQILEFAWQVTQSTVDDLGESETHVRVLPTKAARQGPVPVYKGCGTVAQEHDLIARLVTEHRARGLAAREIAVLYVRKERDRIDALCRRLRALGEVCWVSNDADKGGPVRSNAGDGVRLMTIHAAKGLEFAAVIVSGLDQLPGPVSDGPTLDSNLLYVGLTRATDHLAVTWAGRSPFTDRVQRSTRAVPMAD